MGNCLKFAKVGRTWSFRGSTSRNKVSVGEPSEGSLLVLLLLCEFFYYFFDFCCENYYKLKILTTDLLVLASMKTAAKRDR